MVSLRPPDGVLLRGRNEVMEDFSLGTLLQRVDLTGFKKPKRVVGLDWIYRLNRKFGQK